MKHKNTQPLYIFKRENPQNSEPQNGPRSGLDYIALLGTDGHRDRPEPMPSPLNYPAYYLYVSVAKLSTQSLPEFFFQCDTN